MLILFIVTDDVHRDASPSPAPYPQYIRSASPALSFSGQEVISVSAQPSGRFQNSSYWNPTIQPDQRAMLHQAQSELNTWQEYELFLKSNPDCIFPRNRIPPQPAMSVHDITMAISLSQERDCFHVWSNQTRDVYSAAPATIKQLGSGVLMLRDLEDEQKAPYPPYPSTLS